MVGLSRAQKSRPNLIRNEEIKGETEGGENPEGKLIYPRVSQQKRISKV
jgi:hypothetical protein